MRPPRNRRWPGHPTVRDYIAQIESWYATAGVDDGFGSSEPFTSEEWSALFGPPDRLVPTAD